MKFKLDAHNLHENVLDFEWSDEFIGFTKMYFFYLVMTIYRNSTRMSQIAVLGNSDF